MSTSEKTRYTPEELQEFKELILELLKYSENEISTRDRLFKELYGYLQALRMLDDTGEEIFDLDYSKVYKEQK